MANEADSRHTVPEFRWGETAAQVPDAGVVEPPGGKKDTGWLAGVDVPNGEWWNFLHWAARVAFRYIENVAALQWTQNHVMAGAGAGEGEVTAGVGLTVDVTSARVWIAGQMQKVPAVTNLALAAADPTDSRVDLVCARVTALVPNYHVVTGTPDPNPDPPAVPAGSVAIAEVVVFDLGVVPGTIIDRRQFGAIDLDQIRATDTLRAGSIGGGNFMLEVDGVDGGSASPVVRLGDTSDPIVLVEDFGSIFRIKPEAVTFFTAIRRKFDIGPPGFQSCAGAPALLMPASAGTRARWEGSATADAVAADVRVPNGCTITEVRAYVDRPNNAETIRVKLMRAPKGTGVVTELGSASLPLGSGGINNQTLVISGLSEVVDQAETYYVHVDWFAGAGLLSSELFGAEVEYDETNPFDGI